MKPVMTPCEKAAQLPSHYYIINIIMFCVSDHHCFHVFQPDDFFCNISLKFSSVIEKHVEIN